MNGRLRYKSLLIFRLLALATTPWSTALGSQSRLPDATYYVATNGSDTSGDGSVGAPWATIPRALESVPDGNLIYRH
jgi:hypothetical protein